MDTSLYKTESRLEMLKERTKRCVCKYCGGELKLKQIVFSEIDDARIEIFCKSCNRIEFGVEPEIYRSAKFFVEYTEFDYFQNIDQTNMALQMNVSKACELMSWICQNIGILNEKGFNIALHMNTNFVGETIVLTDEDLKGLEMEG